jgi:hypothetical protein
MKCLCGKKKLGLLHKVASRLTIHDGKWIFDPKWKEHDSKHKIKQDLAISTQNQHERHSTHKRGSYSIFTKRRHPQAYISQSYQEHRYNSHEHHKQSHNLISSISWWAKHMREDHLYGICYKCSIWYKDANMIWYINENATCIHTSTFPTKAQKKIQLQALLANEQM